MLIGALSAFATAYNTVNLYLALIVAMTREGCYRLSMPSLRHQAREPGSKRLAITMFGTALPLPRTAAWHHSQRPQPVE